MDLVRIAFLETYTFDDNAGVMGAILVTDPDTKPLEFRVTAPIKPTNFQKTLYGDVLLEHILVELIALPLLGAIKDDLDLILVRDPLFLGINNKQGVRAIKLFKEKEDHTPSKKSSEEQNKLSGDYGIYVETAKKFASELPEIVERLSQISITRNLIEPFDRLKTACEQVHLQKVDE
ncbi:MAG: hypothetical protein NTX22_14475 [Ignavibacteriales bacterium]|nr:hypothetical protein [Ignavibacteriales bacterium]